jgi:hypothetical protein
MLEGGERLVRRWTESLVDVTEGRLGGVLRNRQQGRTHGYSSSIT